jgi:dnd system-associated protein 4
MKCRVAKDKAELVQALVNAKGTTAPFQTYADAIAFAAAMGAKHKRRIPVKEISKTEPAPISLEIFISRGYDRLIKLLAISETNDRNILSIYDYKAEEERVLIFEEYANGGLEILRHELRGAVDYTERILLIMSQERFQDESIEEEFDLRRFL